MLQSIQVRIPRRTGMMPAMRRHVLSAVMLVAFFPSSSPAQHTKEQDFPCATASDGVPMATCLSDARKKADAALDAVYTNIRNRLGYSDAERLASTQRVWIRYRRANCLAERDLYQGGSDSYPAYVACLEAMTRARTRELQVTYAVKLR